MRLRLSVQRNGLPAANILWNAPETNSPHAYTIARLLEDINQVLPLEAEQWGLEDYIVEVGGFECLHFSPVLQALKDDDHVSIRPLLTAEVRSRTLCGRYQISEDGKHLVDGIPFGRPYLRQPSRPAVRIPPLKRRRLTQDTVAGAEATEVAGLVTESGETSPALKGSALATRGTDKQSPRTNARVRFSLAGHDDELDDSDEDDEEFAPSEQSESSDVSTDSEASSEDSSSASDSSDSDSDSDSSSGSETSSSDSDSESIDSPPDIVPSNAKMLPRPPVPPGKGSKNTKRRNQRRKEAQQLRHLKQSGQLSQDATLEDLRTQLTTHGQTSPHPAHPALGVTMTTPARKRKRLNDNSAPEKASDEAMELERRKQELMAQFEDVRTTPPMAESTILQGIQSEDSHSAEPPKDKEVDASGKIVSGNESTPSRSTKRLRPDTAAIGRILARQTKNVEKKPLKAKQLLAVEEPPEPEGSSNPDFWKSKINLSAFECWDEEHELSAPPFPFKQHWDPASKLMREKQTKKKQKKGRKSRSARNSPSSEEVEDSLILNYDDTPSTAKQESDPSAAIESQLMQDVQVATKPDLPPLPEDIESLPILKADDIKIGTIIAFKLWIINPKTVTPEFSNYKTAIVDREGDSGGGTGVFRLKFADRDVQKKERKVDENGERVYDTNDGFQMEDEAEEDEEDSGIWEGMWMDLVEPKLLRAAD